jgi:hypothetical protein
MSLKIGPIPDRAPVKLTLSLAPETHTALADYAALHANAYGVETPVAKIAAIMIERFLAADAGFRRARKTLRQSEN